MGGSFDPDQIAEWFAEFGPVSVRRMFGGAGIFADGMMMGLVADGVVYLKADAQTTPSFEAEGLAPFSYATKDRPRTITSYWRMPERFYDDPAELARWAVAAREVAQRAAVRTKSSRPKAGIVKREIVKTNARVSKPKRRSAKPGVVKPGR